MKILSFILLLFICSISFSQIDPIGNLYFYQWYECPNNYFSLSWSAPETNEDTIIGYKIYRNNDLYIFQMENFLSCSYSEENSCSDFLQLNYGDAFWIHVTAVYNRDSTESEYTDSAQCYGLALDIGNTKTNLMSCFPNPATDYLRIGKDNVKKILIYDMQGILLLESDENPIDVKKLSPGIYLVKVETDDRKININRIEIVR